MATELTTTEGAALVLVPDPDAAGKDGRYRLYKYAGWLDTTGASWWVPDLATYRDHLLGSGLAASTVSAHLSTIRARYKTLTRDRERFFSMVATETGDFQEQKAMVDELVIRIENGVDPDASPVKTVTRQDVPDSEFLRLTKDQASQLMAAPGVASLKALRDTAVIAMLLCTGIREAELSALEVQDLRQTYEGELSLHVREGKGAKERLVPYGELEWCLAIVDRWLERAGILGGPVFRGIFKGGHTLRPGRLSVRAIEYILANYPIMIDGLARSVKPHDCRRTYARRYYDEGGDPIAIQQNLGHADLKTTLGYIGALDAERRRPPAVYDFDLSGLVNGKQIKG